MKNFKQTWWEKELPHRFEEFESWVGPSSSISKVFAREFVKEGKYKSLIDLGCGNATEFFAYKEEYPELAYTGLDSSEFLFKYNSERAIPMILTDLSNTSLLNNCTEVAFSRHVLEHQPEFQPCLGEMIRLASKVAMHIFFIRPKKGESIINYDEKQNLYHNQYSEKEITEFINSFKKVEKQEWVTLSRDEEALIIHIKQ